MQASRTMLEAMEVLTVRSDFLRIQSKGKKWVSQGLALQVLQDNREDYDHSRLRVGYTVTKKTDKSAVKRNRIKRRLRSVAAEILPLYAKRGVDYVLVGRHGSALRPYEEMKRDLIWCLKKTEFYEKQEEKS